MAEHPVVDELDLAGREVEIDRDAGPLEDVERRRQRRGAFVVDRLALQGIAAVDLVQAAAGVQFAIVRKNPRREGFRLPGKELALAAEQTRPVKPPQTIRE